MSTPYSPVGVTEQAGPVHERAGSVGPVIGVLAVIAVLGAVAVIIGRLCSGRKIMGNGRYDVQGWVEMKCASCIDGNVSNNHRPMAPPPPLVVVVEEQPPERKEEMVASHEQPNQHQQHETPTSVH